MSNQDRIELSSRFSMKFFFFESKMHSSQTGSPNDQLSHSLQTYTSKKKKKLDSLELEVNAQADLLANDISLREL